MKVRHVSRRNGCADVAQIARDAEDLVADNQQHRNK
jgi:hypothetical protein